MFILASIKTFIQHLGSAICRERKYLSRRLKRPMPSMLSSLILLSNLRGWQERRAPLESCTSRIRRAGWPVVRPALAACLFPKLAERSIIKIGLSSPLKADIKRTILKPKREKNFGFPARKGTDGIVSTTKESQSKLMRISEKSIGRRSETSPSSENKRIPEWLAARLRGLTIGYGSVTAS